MLLNPDLKVVALGGGHGLAATLTSLRRITTQLTAIVTVADNGGSSGRLREEFNTLPPGDLRMALAALCADDEWGKSWAEIMQYRFTSTGAMNGHAVGNLLLAALWDKDGDPVQGIDRVASLLKVVGRVLPMAIEPLDIEGTFQSSVGRTITRGQKEVAIAKGKLESLRLIPENATATPEGLAAIASADWITFGPGSWFSSVLPHFLIKQQIDAIMSSKAKKLVILNLDTAPSMRGDEFAGSSPAEHLSILQKFAPNFHCDIALADISVVLDKGSMAAAVSAIGGELVVADIASGGSVHHDPEKLGPVISHIFSL